MILYLAAGYLSDMPYPSAAAAGGELGQLLVEVRALRAQLERSVQENSALRSQLQKQLEQQLSSATLESRPLSLIPASPLRDAFYRRQLLHGEAWNYSVMQMSSTVTARVIGGCE